MTAYEKGFMDKLAEQEGHAASVPASEVAQYLNRYRDIDNTAVTNPLKHIAIGGLAGSSLGAALTALLTGKASNALPGAALGGLAGLTAGAATGSVKSIMDIVRINRLKAALMREFNKKHGFEEGKQLYINT